jgi:peptide chain release factor 3
LKETKAYHHMKRLNKNLKFSSPNAFFAERKKKLDISYAGDIVGFTILETLKLEIL